jgi:hypothetical protein
VGRFYKARPFGSEREFNPFTQLFNEGFNNPNPRSVDALTDLLVFDNLGFAVFRSDRVQRLFSERVEFTSWAWQPVITAPGGAIENTAQSFVLRFPVRPNGGVRGFYYWGVTHVIGLSHALSNGRSFSWGIGAGAKGITRTDSLVDIRNVALGPRAGVFLDRDGSLMASLIWQDTDQGVATLNVFPGLLHLGAHSPGLWASLQHNGGVRFGLTSPIGFGVGVGQPRQRVNSPYGR